jgi:hypothetical protein
MTRHQPAMGLLAFLAAAALTSGAHAQGGGLLASKGSAASACQALSGYTIPAASMGLPTTGATVTSASLVAATAANNKNGEYCLVRGAIHPVDPKAPDILFELNIPTNWNKRILEMGGGGYNGSVVTGLGGISFAPMATTPLAQGYATYGSDSGHESPGGISDASFALNAEALTNYGYAWIKKTHDAVATILRAYYGPSVSYKSYFAGASTGGRESLTAIERFPADYDGAYVGAPTAIFWGLRMIGSPIGKEVFGSPGGYLNAAKQALVLKASLAACDSLDGVADGIVSNVEACKAKAPATLASLRCAGGADTGNTCLSDAQLKVVNTLHTGLTLPYAMAHNSTQYPGYDILEGADFTNAGLGLGSSAVQASPPTTTANGYLYAQNAQWVRYFVTQNPNFDPLTFDPQNPGPYRQRVLDLSTIVGANDPDLSAFKARGGKVIMLQGLADTAVSPNGTILVYNSMVQKMGKASLDGVMRFYTVPGMGHGTGAFVPSWDVLGALDAWVTSGKAPGTLLGTDTTAATAGRTRPLCVYPAWPKYKGSGDPNSASSFTCGTT